MLSRFLSTAFVLVSVAGSSQVEWAPVGAKWWYTFYTPVWGGPPSATGMLKLQSIGDTLVNAISYRVLRWHQYHADYPDLEAGTEYLRRQGDSVILYQDGSDRVLYDFSRDSGESWQVWAFDGWCPDSTGTVMVHDTSSVAISSISLRKRVVGSTWPSHWGLYGDLIEKIGMTESLFFPAPQCVVDIGWYELHCYQDSSIGLYSPHGSATNCDTVIHSIHDSYPSSSLNVSTDQTGIIVTLQSHGDCTYDIEVFDLLGQTLHIGTSQTCTYRIPMNRACGLYLVRVRLSRESVFQGRCVSF
jgi:hypothetical protein